ncbi:helix-turn-helix domain-containing protein [Halorubrum lipolyticum]|uniref:Bacterio-opsin activator HTH domain protein n=1 Tax=Halorubrum lipolyticum DSM 21995 TaxID=1227482 RepID=M0P361_9EURY|nr:bacterio-opsin activator domain-containing protein [Halorubrum lipolyticum]EMA64273.1 Bacterio-opsin activator HTH domain protein [Halorubrum lipolyticum DSM 21995]
MVTLLSAALPHEKFVLSETLSSVPKASFEVEGVVETCETSVMPLIWASAADHDYLDTVLAADPTTEEVELLSEHADRRLYRMKWINNVQGLLETLVTNQATILTATTSDGRWIVRLMFPTHDGVRETMAHCTEHDIDLEMLAIREMSGQPAGRYGLTDAQFEALTAAWKQGFYAVPRGVELVDVAADLGISHQALSERLRRGIDALIRDTLMIDDQPADVVR